MFRFIFLFIFAVSAYSSVANAKDDTLSVENAQSFEAFLEDIRIQAMAQGISKATLDLALTGLTPNPKVIKYDRNQAEFSLNFWRYITSRVSANRLEKGKIKLKENQALLNTVYQKYGIPPSILVAFWGLETNYGKNVGKMNLVRSLATLSFDLRRRKFFTHELLVLLKLIDEGQSVFLFLRLPMKSQNQWGRLLHAPIFHPCASQYA
jgi:membrane-bound lytic murein transglycosylase B